MAKLQFFFDMCKFCHVFLCFLRCFIHFNADLNDFCKECTKKTAAQVRVLLGERCVRKNANAVHDWGHLLLSCETYKMPRDAKRDEVLRESHN